MVIKSRGMRMAVHVEYMGEMRNSRIILVGKPEGMRPLERSERRWNILEPIVRK
jgi:hypothetical protein